MTNVLYIYFHETLAKGLTLIKQLLDLDFIGTTIKRVVGHF